MEKNISAKNHRKFPSLPMETDGKKHPGSHPTTFRHPIRAWTVGKLNIEFHRQRKLSDRPTIGINSLLKNCIKSEFSWY